MPLKTKKKSQFLNQKTHNDDFGKKKTNLRTTMLNRTMESNQNPNSGRIVFSFRLLRFHYNTRLLPFSPFFLSPFFLFPFFLSFPFLRFCLFCAHPLSRENLPSHPFNFASSAQTHSPKKTYFFTLSIFTPTPTLQKMFLTLSIFTPTPTLQNVPHLK